MAESFIASEPVGGVNEYRPGKIGRVTVKLLVEVITPPADCLCQDKTWSNDVHPFQGTKLFPFGVNDKADGTPDDGAELSR